MSIFIYGPTHPTNHNVTNLEVMGQTLRMVGINDASITLAIDLTIDTETGSEEDCDQAVINADADQSQLLQAQIAKTNAVINRSKSLLDAGFVATIGNKTGQFSLNQHESNYGYYEALEDKVTRSPSLLPIQMLSTDKKVINLNSAAKVTILANQAYQRIQYIYFDKIHADDSTGEAGLVIAIRAAATVAAVDLIIDTRA